MQKQKQEEETREGKNGILIQHNKEKD